MPIQMAHLLADHISKDFLSKLDSEHYCSSCVLAKYLWHPEELTQGFPKCDQNYPLTPQIRG